MKELTIERRNNHPKIILLVLMIGCIISSCNRYNNSTHGEVSGIDLADQKTDRLREDPLFYIDGQLCAWVREIHQDRKGNLWFGTNHYGIMRYNGDSLQYFSEDDGLGDGRINEILEDKEGNMWFSTFKGLTRYDGETFTNFPVKVGPIDNDLWGMTIDRNGAFWIGTLDGVVQFDGNEFTLFPIPKAQVSDTLSALSEDRVICVMQDKEGILWFGTDGFGICRYNPSKSQFSHLTKKDGLPDNTIRDLLEDSNGNVWIATMYGGISLYDGDSFTNFTQIGEVRGVEVGGLHEDRNGNIWFAAENAGVYRYDGKSFSNFNMINGLNSNGILSILEDNEGRFWLGGWGGLFRYDPRKMGTGKSFYNVTRNGPWNK